jgi:hypothetical protein
MKKRLKLIAIILLLCGLASLGFAAWSYFHARTLADSWQGYQDRAFDLEMQSDQVKGTPEETRLMNEAHKAQQTAKETLDSAKSNSTHAVIFGISSIIFVLAGIAVIIVHIKNTQAGQS